MNGTAAADNVDSGCKFESVCGNHGITYRGSHAPCSPDNSHTNHVSHRSRCAQLATATISVAAIRTRIGSEVAQL